MIEMEIPRIRRHHKFVDSRGSSSRLFQSNEISLLRNGLAYILEVKNTQIGTVRGLHMQIEGFSGPKILTVTRGSIFDLCIDVRDGSPNKGQVYAGALNDFENKTLVIPDGFLHGYQVLQANTDLIYALDEDPSVGTNFNFKPTSTAIIHLWPLPVTVMSDSDIGAPDISTFPGLRILPSQNSFGED